MENESVVLEFIAAWSRLDPQELASFFAEDGIYHNMPANPVRGRDAIRAMIATFIGSWTQTRWDVLNLASRGNVVIVERLDRTRAGNKAVDLPCTGVFEMEGGKIKAWRDYFDMTTYAKAMR